MRIAVLTLTRDRLGYTKHCFEKLREFAGCDFDHYVFDQGSTDGTAEWLGDEPVRLNVSPYNIGISRGMNQLLKTVTDTEYDVIAKIDNDCELTQPNTLRDIAHLTVEGGALLSPRILGLQNPPRHTAELVIGDEKILDVPQIGGIFLSAPGWVYDEFSYSDTNPYWGLDDVEICAWWRNEGGTCGYVDRLEAWHYLGTDGQHKDIPHYFERTYAEGKLSTLWAS